MGDNNFELDFEFDTDVPDTVGAEYVEDDSLQLDAFDELFDSANLDLDFDEENLSVEDGSSISLDFNSIADSEEDLSAETLLRTQIDISHAFLDYYQMVTNARQRIFAVEESKQFDKSIPPLSEFGYISSTRTRQIVYGFFCSMLEDLVTDPQYTKLNEDQAFNVMLEAMFQEIHWTPNVYEGRLRRTFASIYEKNKKLAQVKKVGFRNAVSGIVDRRRVELAETIYGVNSLPFSALTRFFSDENNLIRSRTVKVADFGDFCASLNGGKSSGTVSHAKVYQGILEFLSSEETLARLQITSDQLVEFSTGELLRRFLVLELNNGEFYPADLRNLVSKSFTNELFTQLYQALLDSMERQSISGEILCLILEIMFAPAAKAPDKGEFLPLFVTGLAQYLSAFLENPAYINPVFYSYIGYTEEDYSNSPDKFQLGYVDGEESIIVQSPDILLDVVGDETNIYHIPMVYTEHRLNCVICPPLEVKNGLFGCTATGHISVSGNMSYRYHPSFAWISTLAIASSGSNATGVTQSINFGQNNSPLLDTLINYTNDFDTTGEQPKLLTVNAPGVCDIIGIRNSEEGAVTILRLDLSDGKTVEDLRGSAFVMDEDGGIIVRYADRQTGEEVILLDSTQFEVTEEHQEETSAECSVILPDDILPGSTDITLYHPSRYLREITRRVCELNALDYDSELEYVRSVIICDLAWILDVAFIDQAIGLFVAKQYIELIEENGGTLDTFNLNTLKELLLLLQGKDNLLSNVDKMTPDVLEELKKFVKNQQTNAVTATSFVNKMDQLDSHILALQVCSRNELSHEGDEQLYYALNSLPAIRSRFRVLEDQMVLMRALDEVGKDITMLLRRVSSIFTAYNTVCTKETVEAVESNLRQGMRIKEITSCLTATKAVLFSELPENLAILKYFVLENNMFGTLTELEECSRRGFGKYDALMLQLRKDLSIGDGEDLSELTEEDLNSRCGVEYILSLFTKYKSQFETIVQAGVLAEASTNVDIQALKAYDIITTYGHVLFNLSVDYSEDFNDTSDVTDRFNEYLGSFLVSYCPLVGEAADDVDGGYDRFAAYLRHCKDIRCAPYDMKKFERYQLKDLHIVEGMGSFMEAMTADGVNSTEDLFAGN